MNKPSVEPRRQIKPPQSLHELREQLCQMYADVSNDRAMVPQADSASNVAGKIINITKLELDAAHMAGKKPSTQFLLGEGQVEQARLANNDLSGGR